MDGIWRFTAERWGVEQAISYTRALSSAVARVAEKPDAGSPQAGLGAPIRKIVAGSHAVYYDHADGIVTVVRILHVRMDASHAFGH